jgi:L-ribulose-5-phosphate 4-epimerase
MTALLMTRELKTRVCDANRRLPDTGLVCLTWGNVSEIDRTSGLWGIKPSGVDYRDLREEDIVVLDLEGVVVEGTLRPSSDTKTHLHLYQQFPEIGGITHTHSPCATAFAQAGRALPCYGTTHADHFHGTVPIVRALTPAEVASDYEHFTGVAIAETLRELNLHPLHMPAVLQLHHAPFTFGHHALESLNNAIALEMCARMALATLQLSPQQPPIPTHILDKHHGRKHGPNAYYGQFGAGV